MAEHHVLAFFEDPGPATQSVQELHKLGVPTNRIDILSCIPMPVRTPAPAFRHERGAPFAFLGIMMGAGLGILFLSVGIFLLADIQMGGMPQVPIPPSIIIIFEATMLGTMVVSFFGFLILNRFPEFSRPTYDVKVTDGLYGVLALVGDSVVAAVETALNTAGAIDVKRLKPRTQDNRMWNTTVAGLAVFGGVVTLVLLLFTYGYLQIPIPTQMANQEWIATQQGPRLAAPAESVPIQGPVLINNQPATAPLPATENSLQRGKVFYGTNCVLCHGATGKGDGSLSVYFTPKPFDLTSANVQKLSDQDIFMVITNGFGVMPQIGENLQVDQRWDVVNYVRTLK